MNLRAWLKVNGIRLAFNLQKLNWKRYPCSGSWDTKVVSSCWWVWGDQVSKSAPSGEYLPTGSFMIRGKKNYLPPSQLVLGFGFLFRLTEDCVEAHKNERVRRHLTSESESVSSITADEQVTPVPSLTLFSSLLRFVFDDTRNFLLRRIFHSWFWFYDFVMCDMSLLARRRTSMSQRKSSPTHTSSWT